MKAEEALDLETLARCPVCGDPRRKLLHDRLEDAVYRVANGHFRLHRCDGCSAGYLDPRPTPTSIGRAYTAYATHEPLQDFWKMPSKPLAWLRRAARNAYVNQAYGYDVRPAVAPLGRLLGRFPSQRASIDRGLHHLHRPAPGRGRLLDVGCGNGSFLAMMRPLGWEVTGIDFDADAAAIGRAAGLDIRLGRLEDAGFAPGSFDAITICHAIEHVHDPVAVLRHALGLLRPGGVLWIATPNLASYAHGRYGRHWRGLEAPRHLVLFDRRSLGEAIERAAGPGAVRVQFPPSPPWAAVFYLEASRRIRAGEIPGPYDPPSRASRWEAAYARTRARLDPALGEELIAVVTVAASS